MNQMIIAASIFVITYIFIISEKIDRTVISSAGVCLLLVFGVLTQEEAIQFIDFNTIGLLIGMMIVVNIIKTTGFFQYIAIKSAKIAKGNPWRILEVFVIITAILSAVLDNVTTVLLIAPVTLVVTDTLELNPIPFLVPQIIASNIGGTATLIGDPPNIMIGSNANLDFMDFLCNTAPISVLILIITIFCFRFLYKKNFQIDDTLKEKLLSFDEKLAIKDSHLLKKSLFILTFIILGFCLHGVLGLESATIALIGASLMLLVSKASIEIVLHEIEWPTIFFFAFLFMLVGSLEKVGIIDYIAQIITKSAKENMFLTTIVLLWSSAIISSFLDNIPFVATMIPIIKKIGLLSGANITPLWWALSLGACLGGNGTLIGASANVIIAGILHKHGYHISFIDYLKVGFPIMILSIILSTGYLIAFYL